MRSCHTNGNGSQCDICHTLIDPFDTYRLVCKTLHPGPRYPEVSSDTRYHNINNFHLCEDCYDKVIETLDNLAKNGGKI
jgi:hypothetical protein